MKSNLLNKNALYGAGSRPKPLTVSSSLRKQTQKQSSTAQATTTDKTAASATTSEGTLQPWQRYYMALNSSGVQRAPTTGTRAMGENIEAAVGALNQPQTPQTPQTSTGGEQSPNEYYDWLTRLGLSEMGSGAMSYADYLTRTGTDTNRDYQAAVRQAETDYAKARATYGSTGESLARSGMSASGYADYITGAGFAAMQGAKVAAADTKALTDSQNAASYADYLAAQEATAASYNNSLRKSYADYVLNQDAAAKAASQEIGTYVTSLAANGTDTATIRARAEAYAKSMGYTLPDNLDDIISSSVTAYGTKTSSEQAAETAQTRANIQEVISAGIENNLTGAQIRQQLEQAGYSADAINREMSDYSERYSTAVTQAIGRASSLDEVYANSDIDRMVSEGELTQEQAAAAKQAAEAKRTEFINKWLDYSGTDDETKQGIDAARSLYASGDLTDAQYGDIMGRIGRESVESVIDKAKKSYTGDDKVTEPVTELLTQYNAVGDNKKYYNEVGVEAIQKEIADSIASTDGGIVNVHGAGDATHYDKLQIKLSVNNGEYSAEERIEFHGIVLDKKSGREIYDKAVATKASDGLYTYNGGLYYFSKGKLYSLIQVSKSSVGSAENAETLMKILRSKATVISDVGGATSGVMKGAKR